jgi:inhibitor of cysteine peptidase
MNLRMPQVFILVSIVTLIACAPITAPNGSIPSADNTATPQSEAPVVEIPAENLAMVDTVEVRLLESSPVQAEVVARGNLADGCTEIGDPAVLLSDNEFQVTLPTSRPADAMCTQALVPFEQIIPLDVTDAASGEYTVVVNGVTGTFTLP